MTTGEGITTSGPMWEHTYLPTTTRDLAKFIRTLNDLAPDGWESRVDTLGQPQPPAERRHRPDPPAD